MTDLAIEVQERLTPAQSEQVHRLVAECTGADSASPFSEQVLLNLRHHNDPSVRHVLAIADGQLAGYAQLDASHPIDGPSAEIAVAPAFRRKGYATSLLSALMIHIQPHALRLWSHGDSTSAASLAQAFGFREVRTLWQMRRSLVAPLPSVDSVDGISFRCFSPETDQDAWLAANALTFSDHPEQGRWTSVDLESRISQKWFDEKGFLLAVNAEDEIAGFCWTKVHGDSSSDMFSQSPIGELYVLGVTPDYRRRGLARALAVSGCDIFRTADSPPPCCLSMRATKQHCRYTKNWASRVGIGSPCSRTLTPPPDYCESPTSTGSASTRRWVNVDTKP